MGAIVLSIPIFFALIALELGWGIATHRNSYRLNDTFSNIGCGIGQQVTGLFFKGVIFMAYIYLYTHFRWFTIEETVWNWILLFLGVDFCYYWFHRFSHEVNWIWATHIVHHQSEEYNLSVALRQSWFQGLISWAFYIPLALLGFHPTTLITVAAFNTLYQFWIHTRIIGKMGPLEWILNTPSHHRVHHGSNPKYIDKNHAGTLIIWDRLFGTFQEEEEEVVYGITTPLQSWNPVYANFHYWRDLWNESAKIQGARQKLKFWMAPPGWRPSHMGGPLDVPEKSPDTFTKFNTRIPRAWQAYAATQFLAILAFTSFFLFTMGGNLMEKDVRALIDFFWYSGLILGSMHVLGLMFEHRASAWNWEKFRLLFIAVGGWGPWRHGTPEALEIIMIAYAVIMYLWILSIKPSKQTYDH